MAQGEAMSRPQTWFDFVLTVVVVLMVWSVAPPPTNAGDITYYFMNYNADQADIDVGGVDQISGYLVTNGAQGPQTNTSSFIGGQVWIYTASNGFFTAPLSGTSYWDGYGVCTLTPTQILVPQGDYLDISFSSGADLGFVVYENTAAGTGAPALYEGSVQSPQVSGDHAEWHANPPVGNYPGGYDTSIADHNPWIALGGGTGYVEPGDANEDGRVDINDLTIVLAHYNQTGMVWSDGEFTGDGTVDINDLTIVLANYGWTSTSLGVMKAVPEPSSLVLLGIGAVGLLARAWQRRRRAA
jgi:hypothetical protein